MVEGPPISQAVAQIVAQHLLEAVRGNMTATLAAALIITSGRTHSVQEALDLQRDFQNALYPASNHGHYKEWAKTSAERITRVHT